MLLAPSFLVPRLTHANVVLWDTLAIAEYLHEWRPDAGLLPSQEKTLTALASDFLIYLKAKPDARLTLEGHADPRGSVEYNLALGERRAK